MRLAVYCSWALALALFVDGIAVKIDQNTKPATIIQSSAQTGLTDSESGSNDQSAHDTEDVDAESHPSLFKLAKEESDKKDSSKDGKKESKKSKKD